MVRLRLGIGWLMVNIIRCEKTLVLVLVRGKIIITGTNMLMKLSASRAINENTPK